MGRGRTCAVIPGQGGFEFSTETTEDPVITYAPIELAPGILEGDATNIVRYLDFYVRAVKEVGRGRSNDIGFGELHVDRKIVREVAYQHGDNPDRQEVKDRVVASRSTRMERAGHLLNRRAEYRDKQAAYWQSKGALTQEDVAGVRLPEDAYMLEGQWYGSPDKPADKQKTKDRTRLYKQHRKYMDEAASKREIV